MPAAMIIIITTRTGITATITDGICPTRPV
jgi:hypothetical protein